MTTLTNERIMGRRVEIEVGEAPGIGWSAVGIVRGGLVHEVGLRFQATAPTPQEARQRLQAEIEAYFA